MRVLIFSGLLACVHGLGNTFPYANTQKHIWTEAAQASGKWAADKCKSGTKQSPINIVSANAVVMKGDPGPIMTYGFEADVPMDWEVAGTTDTFPSTVELSYPLLAKGISPSPVVIGGPLEQTYAFSHIEFHWGKDASTMGAEHTIDGVRAKMEMYVVFHKTSFATLGQEIARQALTKTSYGRAVRASVTSPLDPAGIAVIAYQIDEGAENSELLPLTLAIKGAGNKAKASMTVLTTHTPGTGTSYVPLDAANMNISKLLMQDEGFLEDYYYYDGSLTNPADESTHVATESCAEIVRWIIPTKRLTMSTTQMAAFNSETNFAMKDAPLRNSRMIQTGAKIAGITVNRRMKAVTAADNAIWRNLAGSLLSVGTFGLVHNLLTQDDTAKALTENPVVDILQDIEQRFVRPAPQERQSFNHHHHPQDVQY